MSTNPAVLGSPPAHLNSGEHDSRQDNDHLNKPFISGSFDKRPTLKDRFLSSPRTLRAETIDTANSGAKFNMRFSTIKKLNAQGVTNQTMETLKKPRGDRYGDKKKKTKLSN